MHDTGVRFEDTFVAVGHGEPREPLDDAGAVECLVGKTPRRGAGAEGGVQQRTDRRDADDTAQLDDRPARILLEVVPALEGIQHDGHVGRTLLDAPADDARRSVRRTEDVALPVALDADHRASLAGEGVNRGATHHAEPDDDDVRCHGADAASLVVVPSSATVGRRCRSRRPSVPLGGRHRDGYRIGDRRRRHVPGQNDVVASGHDACGAPAGCRRSPGRRPRSPTASVPVPSTIGAIGDDHPVGETGGQQRGDHGRTAFDEKGLDAGLTQPGEGGDEVDPSVIGPRRPRHGHRARGSAARRAGSARSVVTMVVAASRTEDRRVDGEAQRRVEHDPVR